MGRNRIRPGSSPSSAAAGPQDGPGGRFLTAAAHLRGYGFPRRRSRQFMQMGPPR